MCMQEFHTGAFAATHSAPVPWRISVRPEMKPIITATPGAGPCIFAAILRGHVAIVAVVIDELQQDRHCHLLQRYEFSLWSWTFFVGYPAFFVRLFVGGALRNQ